ncbi:tetratricopeptide repeat protein [Thiomicrorhabdus sp. 6S2-11]|uniref:Tetratricopeptide repeat protein n=1 Tax=Thiomicrorhabdus marina TaxID=2818442 RepID=A0ABS3Q5M7_9GAMM|nr:tetratricopeptide repeat protein [Thiomicrorhabdus marina]
MSVLLDALKKAAEEKNKHTLESEKSQALKLSAEDSKEPSLLTSSEDSQDMKVSSDKTLKTLDESLPKASNLDLDEIVDDFSEETVVPISTLKPSVLNQNDEMLESREQQSSAIKLKFSAPEVTSIDRSDVEVEVPDVPEQFAELERGVLKVTAENNEESDLQKGDPSSNPSDNAVEQTVEKRNEGDEGSYQWSLDQIPAYVPVPGQLKTRPEHVDVEQSSSVEERDKINSEQGSEKLANNSILTKNAHATPYGFRKSILTNPKIILSLISITVFMLVGIYTAYYYQQENERLEASFDRYKIDPIKINLPENTVIEPEVKPVDADSQNVKTLGDESKNAVANVEIDDQNTVEVPLAKIESEPEMAKLKTVSQVSASKKAAVTEKPKINSLKTSDKVLVMDTAISTIIQPKPQAVKAQITKSKALTQEQNALAEGYGFYQEGDWKSARDVFAKVLESEPKNLKAKLGFAATQNYLGNPEDALAVYQDILKENPGNSYALEAVAEIANTVLELNSEWMQQLLELAQKYPKSAVLQNALGNVYAKQENWFKAQQQYFSAVAIKDSEPTYLMNLAVSLDHLGKYLLAEDYYKKALIYQKNGTAVDQDVIKQRLLVLRQFRNMEP